jgi:osmotically-inducible protein OsmY
MKYLYKLAFILVFGAGMSLAQTGATGQSPATTPPTFPSGQSGTQTTNPDQSNPNPSTNPDQTSTMGQTGTTSTTAITKAQSDIQNALRRQLPASADSVTVSVSDDNKIELHGTVSSDTERQQIMDVAKAAAPDQKIENKMKLAAAPPVGGNSSAEPQPATGQGNSPDQKDNSHGARQQAQPPLTLIAYQTGTQDKGSDMGQNSNQGSNPQHQTPSTTESSHYPNDNTQTPNSAPSDTNATQAASSGSTEVQSNIQKALQQDSSLSNANINVNVTSGNKVELTGTVADKEQKKTAKKIAESNAAGYKVVDHLKVAGSNSNSSNPTKY